MNNLNTNIFEGKTGDGNNAENLLTLASESFSKNNFYRARFYLESLIRKYPVKAEYFSAIGTVCKKLGNKDEAKSWYSKAIELDPESYEAYYNIGLVFGIEGNSEAEINSYMKAIQIDPGNYIAYYGTGNAYRKLEQFEKAELFYKQTIKAKSDFDNAYYNLGVIYEKTGVFLEALECYNRTIKLNPNHGPSIWNKALLNLKLEKFETGWCEYEFRKKLKSINTKDVSEKQLKNQDINGAKILVYSEQGLGDNIQFFRYLKLLKDKGAFVIFECNPKLYQLFEGHQYIDKIILQTETKNFQIEYDYQVALLSLPKYFNTKMETIPNDIPYLFAGRDKIREWEKIICRDNDMKVGIAWSGETNNLYGNHRSCPIDELVSLFSINGAKFYSLQKDNYNSTNKELPVTVFKNIDAVPFIDSAAIIKNLDLVISIDTSIAHLAGAIGKETWVMLPYHSDWRWFLNRNDSPWYPNMKLFRQQKNGDWKSIVEQVKDRLLHKLFLKNIPQNFSLN